MADLQEKYGIENNYYDKNKYKQKMGPKNADDIFDLFSASNPNNEPQYNNAITLNHNPSNATKRYFRSLSITLSLIGLPHKL